MNSLDNIVKVLINLNQDNKSMNEVKMYKQDKEIYSDNWDNTKKQEIYDPSTKKLDEKLIRWLLNQPLFYKTLSETIYVSETVTSYGTIDKVEIINREEFLKAIDSAINNKEITNTEEINKYNKTDFMNKFIKLFNYSDTRNSMKKILNFTDKSVTPNANIPNLKGGSKNFSGEYEAYKNTMAIEKSSIKMIGGGDDIWAPGLEKDAVKRSTLFFQALDSIETELANKSKRLASNDLTKIKDAINSLAKRESNIYGELKTLEKYAQLLEKYKDDETHEVNKKNQITSLVSKYFKNVSRADKNSSKISVVLSALINSINL